MEHHNITTYNVRDFLNAHSLEKWIGCRWSMECPFQLSDLTTLDLYLRVTVNNTVYAKKSATMEELKHEYEPTYMDI
jgi:hypothetical protein